MILPCKHKEQITRQVQPTVDLLANMDVLHPDVLLEHAIQPEDYKGGLVFRLAVESIMLPVDWEHRRYQVWQANAMDLPIGDEAVDAVVSSPPYFGALDYARDNRLRLWFLGC